jgi:hypothetical protein
MRKHKNDVNTTASKFDIILRRGLLDCDAV